MTGRPALVAIDLGAESCRVSLLQWHAHEPQIRMVHRFPNGPVVTHAGICWDLDGICRELVAGLRRSAEIAAEGIAGIGVAGWAVDYVRIDPSGRPIAPPFCYRDPRNQAAMERVHAIIPAAELYARTGVQIQPLNTIYQLYADKLTGIPDKTSWINLPEYILHWLGAPRIAEHTNATHTSLVDPATRQWLPELFRALGLDEAAAPPLVSPGTRLGAMRGELADLPAFAKTKLIAPACHDTASAVAGISGSSGAWAYISSGTWSLIGAPLPSPVRTPEAFEQGFTNLGAADGSILFHRGLTGMWLLRQCMNTWDYTQGWTLEALIAEAAQLPEPDELLDLDDPALVMPGDMPARINDQRQRRGLPPLPNSCADAPAYTNLIFHSLGHRYGAILRALDRLTGRATEQICVVGGGSRNGYLNALTERATGLPVKACAVESSTLGNFAVQCAALESDGSGVKPNQLREAARELAAAQMVG
ncbi:MAG: FGGY-family carbohydrate kinase [Acidobacteriaceae bacterium]